jgi:hypothetical protein
MLGRARAERAEAKAEQRAGAEARARVAAQRSQLNTVRAIDSMSELYLNLFEPVRDKEGKVLLSPEGKVRFQMDESQQGKALLIGRRMTELIEKLLQDDPSTIVRSALTRSLTRLGAIQANARQGKEALASAVKALDLLRDLSTDEAEGFPPADWGETCFILGALFMNLDQPADGITPFTQSIRFYRTRLNATPSDSQTRRLLSDSYFHLGEVQRRAGRVDAAATTAWDRLQLWPSDADQIYDVACELSRCAAASQAEARERYGAAAVGVLHQAVAAGFKDVAGLKADADFAPLRGRADFRKLVAELEKK